MALYQHGPHNRSSLSYDEVSAITEGGSDGLWIGGTQVWSTESVRLRFRIVLRVSAQPEGSS